MKRKNHTIIKEMPSIVDVSELERINRTSVARQHWAELQAQKETKKEGNGRERSPTDGSNIQDPQLLFCFSVFARTPG